MGDFAISLLGTNGAEENERVKRQIPCAICGNNVSLDNSPVNNIGNMLNGSMPTQQN